MALQTFGTKDGIRSLLDEVFEPTDYHDLGAVMTRAIALHRQGYQEVTVVDTGRRLTYRVERGG